MFRNLLQCTALMRTETQAEAEILFICAYAPKGMCWLDFMFDMYYHSLALISVKSKNAVSLFPPQGGLAAAWKFSVTVKCEADQSYFGCLGYTTPRHSHCTIHLILHTAISTELSVITIEHARASRNTMNSSTENLAKNVP